MKSLLLAVALFATTAFSNTLTLGVGGITYHGSKVDPFMAQQMPRRITDNGKFVSNPAIGLSYSRGFWTYSGEVFKDCFDKSAFILAAGPRTKLFELLELSALGGIYYREVQSYTDRKGNTYTVAPPRIYTDGRGWQLFPTVLARASVSLPYRMRITVAGNGYINMAQLGIDLL